MEFAVHPAATTAPAPTSAFLSDFRSVLKLNGCGNLFGVDTINKGTWVEMKIGGASVVLPDKNTGGLDDDMYIPVTFAFDQQEPTFRVHGKCGVDHKHTSKPKPKPTPK
ncbi:hypothetical protein W97_08390 [Coniosporium apollinis CBS 100218]|uniref:Uncharacterized protein n=1 Tax=Coniosporium apollinis (strain CBS 100218) TaxID=1168221 RepID=R7Z4I6_CONA1|nr:uncharacterized protein W97_08390 [Coniosporium apollinis CBS 100218]EON69077.1 hypothetical protein W97_08390 [Coniosporium apollinis CBS 100218]